MDTSRLHEAPLGSLLVLAARLAQHRWGGYLAAHHNLTPAGVAVLTTLGMHGGDLGHRRIAELCFFKPATLTGIVDTLERSGHVVRLPDEHDRRAIRIGITESGRLALAKVHEVRTLNTPLTPVDADPAKAAIIREFLLELISTMEDPDDVTTRG
ncbi:MarR family winged helix-turn-helix transcriptional regulator [Catenuloplanes atrovinosus]|uniref:DNA-binding MarR family transcriptional regulator n=1 Tax=Catenuloplanes atrovinosus TaxID=137266 RepID=A0AAE3YXY9_9ACTN|nr:MarR family transcriptional regulator [Catenuloplanes atrovinosus]MDR7280757.1 DNA-binding MarR family transcriptional regulator [Catenuloplanes atrovinosus]